MTEKSNRVVFTRAKGLDLEWCKSPDKGLVRPDKVIFMEVKSNEAEARPGFGEERYEVNAFQAKVRQTYADLLEAERNHPSTADLWQRVDGNRPIQVIADELLSLSQSLISSVSSSPLSKLWLDV